MDTPGNFKQIYFEMVFWLQPSCKIWLYAAPFLQFFEEIGFSLTSAEIFRTVFL